LQSLRFSRNTCTFSLVNLDIIIIMFATTAFKRLATPSALRFAPLTAAKAFGASGSTAVARFSSAVDHGCPLERVSATLKWLFVLRGSGD
jgi:hypothetical protein